MEKTGERIGKTVVKQLQKMIKVSIIIVHYKVKDRLFACLESIYNFKPKIEFEIIVVDNDEKKIIKKELLKKFPKVKYVESDRNVGYGSGNNLGAKQASGSYLFFLNPDTLIFKNTIDFLFNFLEVNKEVGIVSPLLVDKKEVPFVLQGTKELTPLRGIVCLSILNKIFPDNPISKNYWLKEWDHMNDKEMDVCPGTAFMVSAENFKKIGGFDEQFFLFFEEDDISKKIKNLGYKIYILSKARLFHEVGASTKQSENTSKFFAKSRFLYFKKNFGTFQALLVESFARINKFSALMVITLLAALFLRIYHLSQNMTFIGDQGWFYLSARDLLISGKVPLVGITSSHTWLHQGPLWTYMLSFVLFVSKFNPVSGAYLTILFGLLTTFLIYKLGTLMFSSRVGFVGAALWATSPLIIFFDRMPFDPSPIPFFVLLYMFSLFKWIKGDLKYFPFTIFLIAILYNLELATFTLVFPFGVLLLYGLIKRKDWAMNLLNGKTISISLIALLVPMLPIIVYDFSHGFKQTIVFIGWTLYKPFSFLIKHSSGSFLVNFKMVINFVLVNLQKIIFQANLEIAVLIFVLSLVYLFYVNKKNFRVESAKFILLFLLVISLLGILVNQTPSDAYLPVMLPFLIFAIALLFDLFLNIKIIRYLAFLFLVVIVVSNGYLSLNNNYGYTLQERLNAVNKIISLTRNDKFNLVGRGQNSQFTSFIMNYEYLLWWKNRPVSKVNQKTKVFLLEDDKGIHVFLKH